jgi:hypothetical protein
MFTVTQSDGVISKQSGGVKILNCTDIPIKHWFIKYKEQNDSWNLVLNVNQIVSSPKIHVRNGLVFIGVEQGLFVLDQKSGNLIDTINNISYVQWIEEDSPLCVIFAAEDEIIVLSNSGHLLWRENLPDVIETTDVKNNILEISDMSGEMYKYMLPDGQKVT